MKKKHKSLVVVILSIILVFGFSVSAFAYSQTLTGSSRTYTAGNRKYTTFNSITYISGRGVKAYTDITCNTGCSAGELGVFPTLQDYNLNIVLAPGWIYNTVDSCSGISAGTSFYSTSSGTYYSGGDAKGYNDVSGNNNIFVTYVSPGLTINESKSAEIGKYGVNENGQTYGVVNDFTAEKYYPDLVGAVGTDGTEGYILSKELLQMQRASSREEAVALMRDPEYIQGRLIDLYAADGTTVIGKFLLGGLIGVTVQEGDVTTTYNKEGTIVETYANGTERIVRWR